jgi:SdiA-regulated
MISPSTYSGSRWFILFLLFFLISCQLFIHQQPKEYKLNHPKTKILSSNLAEISGIYYVPDKKILLAISDDKGSVFAIDSSGENERDYFGHPFAEPNDYEDIVQVDSIIYVLSSNGSIVGVNAGGQATIYNFTSDKKDDFETMYYEPSENSLITLCKSCAHETKKGVRTAHRFGLADKKFDPAPYYTINISDVDDAMKDTRTIFEPSAAAIHPVEKKLYILSSAGKLLAVTDLKGKVEHAYRLNPALFPQPEGITFAPNGDMYISNEAKRGKPSLLKFAFREK